MTRNRGYDVAALIEARADGIRIYAGIGGSWEEIQLSAAGHVGPEAADARGEALALAGAAMRRAMEGEEARGK